MQSGDHVIVLLAALIIQQRPVLHRILDDRQRDMNGSMLSFLFFLFFLLSLSFCSFLVHTPLNCQFQHIQCSASITIRKDSDLLQCILIYAYSELAQSTLLIFQGTSQDSQDVFFSQSMQCEDSAARQESSIDLKAWILCRGSDQCHNTTFYMGQHRILLRLIEAMDLIDKQNSSLSRELPKLLCLLYHFPQISHPC